MGLGNDILERVEVLAFKEDCQTLLGSQKASEIKRRSDLVKHRKNLEKETKITQERLNFLTGSLKDVETVILVRDAIKNKQIVRSDDEDLCPFDCLFVDRRMESFMQGSNLCWTKCLL